MGDLGKMSTPALVDLGYRLKSELDTVETELDGVKAEVRKRATKEKADYYIGDNHFVNVSSQTSTSCDSLELYDTYVEIGREKDFFAMVKPLVGQAKKDLGETLFGSISNEDTKPYSKVMFKEKTPKKYLK